MKKLMSVLVAVVFMTGMVVAQNDATVEQINDYNKANVDQSGSNEADIYQKTTSDHESGTWNTANVTQEGESNYMDYEVEGYDNLLRSEQFGDNNKAYIDEGVWNDGSNYSNNVFVEQDNTNSGDLGNFLRADLKGDENAFRFWQTGDNNSIRGAYGHITQVGTESFAYEGDNSFVKVEQVGDDNVMRGNIYGTDQRVVVEQMGDENFSGVKIKDNLGTTEGSYKQFVTVRQWEKDNDSRVDIEGSDNRVLVEQHGADMSGDQRSIVFIEGSDNKVQHYQTLDGEGGRGQGGSLAKSDIDGDYNKSFIGKKLGQEGVDNKAIHTVTGDNNKAYTDQDGERNKAFVTQTGDHNVAKQIQDMWPEDNYDDVAPWEANDNVSLIEQDNDYNTAKTYQFGDDNVAKVYQDGDDRAYVDQGIWDQGASWNHGYGTGQFGNDNRAIIDQNGGTNVSRVLQLGNNNNVNINQGPIQQLQ